MRTINMDGGLANLGNWPATVIGVLNDPHGIYYQPEVLWQFAQLVPLDPLCSSSDL